MSKKFNINRKWMSIFSVTLPLCSHPDQELAAETETKHATRLNRKSISPGFSFEMLFLTLLIKCYRNTCLSPHGNHVAQVPLQKWKCEVTSVVRAFCRIKVKLVVT